MIDIEVLLPEAEEPPRDQGDRLTCLAFAISNLNRSSAPATLSPEFVYQSTALQTPGWKPGDGLIPSIAFTASAPGQPEESHYPYQADEPKIPIAPLPHHLTLHGTAIRIHPQSAAYVAQSIRGGYPIGLVLHLTPEFYRPTKGIVPFNTFVLPDTLHAVLAVGIGKEQSTGTEHILIQNSWGPGWGNNGHAWLPSQYLDLHTACSFGH